MTASIKFSNHMEQALVEANKALNAREVPIGAVIIDVAGNLVAAAHNQVETAGDATLHAEMLVIKQAMQKTRSKFLDNMDIYVTLEPCPMCAYALALARVRRIYFGAEDKKFGGIENGPRIFSNNQTNHKPEIYSGLMAEECGKLLKDFFAAKRN